MKKRSFIAALLIAVMALTVMGLTACNVTFKSSLPTVSFWSGTELLKADKVEAGMTATEWTPEREGYEFMGWYAEASLSTEFDFAAPIEGDTDVFAAWRSTAHVEDTAAWYFIGTGAGDMAASKWGHETAGLFMTKQEVEGKNVYTIQIKMYANDKFQITHSGTWDYQQGIGHMVGFEYAAGVNPYAPDLGEMTAADKKYGEVKNADGEVVFFGGDEYDKSAEVWNVWLAEGHDGIYKFTFTTYPQNPAYNTIEWQLVEAIEPLAATHDMYIAGTMNEWSGKDVLDSHNMTKSEDGSYWTIIYTVTEADYADWTANEGPFNGELCAALKVKNRIDGTDYGINGGNIFLKAGTYAIKYIVATNVVEYKALGWFLVGTFVDADGKAVNFSVKEGVTPQLTIAENGLTASVTVTISDVSGMSDYSWIASQGKVDAFGAPAGFAFKVVYGSEFAIDQWYGAAGGDNFYLAADEYTITIDLETKAIIID